MATAPRRAWSTHTAATRALADARRSSPIPNLARLCPCGVTGLGTRADSPGLCDAVSHVLPTRQRRHVLHEQHLLARSNAMSPWLRNVLLAFGCLILLLVCIGLLTGPDDTERNVRLSENFLICRGKAGIMPGDRWIDPTKAQWYRDCMAQRGYGRTLPEP